MHIALSLHFKNTIFQSQLKIMITDTLLYFVTDKKNWNYGSIDPKEAIRHPLSSKFNNTWTSNTVEISWAL